MSLSTTTNSSTSAITPPVIASDNSFKSAMDSTPRQQITPNYSGVPDRPANVLEQLHKPANISKNEEQSSASLKRIYAGIMLTASDFIPGMENPRTNPQVRRRDQERLNSWG